MILEVKKLDKQKGFSWVPNEGEHYVTCERDHIWVYPGRKKARTEVKKEQLPLPEKEVEEGQKE